MRSIADIRADDADRSALQQPSTEVAWLDRCIEDRRQLLALVDELCEALERILSEGDYTAPEGMKRIAREALAKLHEQGSAE